MTSISARPQALNLDRPVALPKAVPGETQCPVEMPASKGILDYPKDLSMHVTELAAKGQAKNSMEFIEDIQDIGGNLGDSWNHLKEGEVIGAMGDSVRAVGNTVSAGVNLVQTGLSATLGGLSLIASAPLNLLDKAAEIGGEKGAKSDSGIGKALGRISTFFGGRDSNTSLTETMANGTRAGIQAARQDD